MNKRGASKGKVLIIALDEEPTKALEDNQGFLLVFDTFKQITDYCKENCIDLDSVLIDELDKETGKSTQWSDTIDEVEF